MNYTLLSVNADSKTIKGVKYGYLTGMLSLASSDASGYQVCKYRTDQCSKFCLFNTGRGRFSNVMKARIKKTRRFFEDKKGFFDDLILDINKLVRDAKNKNLIPAVRLNGYSDITWEKIKVSGDKNIFQLFSDVQFYDYTAYPIDQRDTTIKNYHLTFSRKENTKLETIKSVLSQGHNFSVVFNDSLPEEWEGLKVISGDDSDLRFLDPKGFIVGLLAKGSLKKESVGFAL